MDPVGATANLDRGLLRVGLPYVDLLQGRNLLRIDLRPDQDLHLDLDLDLLQEIDIELTGAEIDSEMRDDVMYLVIEEWEEELRIEDQDQILEAGTLISVAGEEEEVTHDPEVGVEKDIDQAIGDKIIEVISNAVRASIFKRRQPALKIKLVEVLTASSFVFWICYWW